MPHTVKRESTARLHFLLSLRAKDKRPLLLLGTCCVLILVVYGTRVLVQ